MRTGIFLCLSPGFIVNSLLSAPPPPAFSHLLREGSSELSFCALKHPRFEHFPPLFRQNVPSFVHLSPLSTDNFPRSAETTPRFVEYLPTGRKGTPFSVVGTRLRAIAPHEASPFFALPPFSGSAISAFFASAVAALRRVAEVPHNSPAPSSVRADPPSILPFVKPTAVKSAPHHCTFAHPMRQKHRIPARKTQICALLFAGCHRNCIFAVSYILVHGIYRAANRHLPWWQR